MDRIGVCLSADAAELDEEVRLDAWLSLTPTLTPHPNPNPHPSSQPSTPTPNPNPRLTTP